MDRFDRVVAALAFLAAVAVVGYISLFRTGATADTALGFLIGIGSAGAGWYFRGRVQNPQEGQITVQAAGPAQARATPGGVTVTRAPEPPPAVQPSARTPATDPGRDRG